MEAKYHPRADNAPQTTSAFINFAEVKRLLGTGDKLTRRLIRQGRIPIIRVGPRKCLFERQSVIDAVKSLQEGGQS